jgi:hypothetical protein
MEKAAHGDNLMGADLYQNLIQYFVTHLNSPRGVGIALFVLLQCSCAIYVANRIFAGRSATAVLCG